MKSLLLWGIYETRNGDVHGIVADNDSLKHTCTA